MSIVRWILVIVVIGLIAGGGDSLGAFFDQVGEGVSGIASGSNDDGSSHSASTNPDGCKSPASPVSVTFSGSQYPNIIAHIKESWRAGYPEILTINRSGASERRDQLLAGIPTEPGMDRDEAPAAALRDRVQADVEYVPSSENRSAGASLEAQIAPYCNGVDVRYRFTD